MHLPYRTQQGLKRLAVLLLILAVAAVLIWLCWLLWLNRFVVYTRDGVILDFEQSQSSPEAEAALPPENETPIPIYYNEGENEVELTTELTQLAGYYIDRAVLQTDLDAIKAGLSQLPAGTPVMLEVKNSFGSFYYSTNAGLAISDEVDVAKVDALIEYMDRLDLYTIASLPALRDYTYGLNNVPDGLPVSGGYLWADDDYRYWLNPGANGTLTYLGNIAEELKGLGFDEVVFCDFRFPDTNKIVFSGDKTQTLATAAQVLVDSYATASFAVSFEGSSGFTPPAGRSRVYRLNVDAAQADTVAENAGVTDPAVNLVFVTPMYDTRFDAYGVLRPMSSII